MKQKLKECNIIYISHINSSNSLKTLNIKQKLYKKGLRESKINNNTLKLILIRSIFSKYKHITKGSLYFIYYDKNKSITDNLNSIKNLNKTTKIIALKLNNKIYSLNQLKNIVSLNYLKNVKILNKTLNKYIKNFVLF